MDLYLNELACFMATRVARQLSKAETKAERDRQAALQQRAHRLPPRL
jgi:hypothetical protein